MMGGGRTGTYFGVAVLLAMAQGCSVIPKLEHRLALPGDPPASDEPLPSAEKPREAQQALSETPAPARLVYYRGVTGALTESAPAPARDALAGRTITLAFVNAPAADVAHAVIGEVLGQPVAIADGVSGTITLSSGKPIPALDALTELETVLAESGLALVRTDSGFLLTKLSAADEQSARLNRPGSTIGHGMAFVPVRFGTPSEIVTLIEPFVSDRARMTPDDARGTIIVRGPNADIANAQDAIATFDTPHLVDRTFGMFRLQFADVDTLRAELLSVLTAASNTRAPAEIIALPRLNLLFVIARSKETFDDVRGWIDRLDQPSGGDKRRLRYYYVQNTDAETLADQLANAFGGASRSDFDTHESPDSTVQPSFRNRPVVGANEINISADAINNALIIRATDQEYREIADLIEKMDVLAPQVLIEATIAEVTLNDDLSYGVRWFYENAESAAVLSDNARGAIGAVFPGFSYTYFDSNVRVALNTLASVTDVTVLSAPSIMVLNNQTANLQVGDEVPIVTQQAQSVVDAGAPIVSTLQLRETGVILEVKPRINASDIVVLEITQEVSDVTQTTTSGIDSPTIQQRRFTSTVAVRNNGTVALGGLIRESFTDNESGVPFLKDIPGLGYVFKSRDITKRRTELIVFLTPRIIRNDDDAQNAIKYIRREMTRLGESKS